MRSMPLCKGAARYVRLQSAVRGIWQKPQASIPMAAYGMSLLPNSFQKLGFDGRSQAVAALRKLEDVSRGLNQQGLWRCVKVLQGLRFTA